MISKTYLSLFPPDLATFGKKEKTHLKKKKDKKERMIVGGLLGGDTAGAADEKKKKNFPGTEHRPEA